MSNKQKNILLILSIIMFAAGVTTLILGKFPMDIYGHSTLYTYELEMGSFLFVPITVMGSIVLILSILFKKDIIKKPKEGLIAYGLINMTYAGLIIAGIILIYIFPLGHYSNWYSVIGIFVVVLSHVVCLSAIISVFLAFKFQVPISCHLSPKKALKKKNELTKDTFAKLRSLKELLDTNIITQEEYEEKRKKYLEGL